MSIISSKTRRAARRAAEPDPIPSKVRRSARLAVEQQPSDIDCQSEQPLAAESSSSANINVGNEIEVPQAAHHGLQPDEKRSILSLDDDSLMETFSHMNMKGLSVMADCCTRFRDLANEVVRKGFRKKDFDEYLCLPSKPRHRLTENGEFRYEYDDENFAEKTLMAMKFGKFISRVEIVGRDKDSWRIGPVLKNCTSVKSFRLRNLALGIVPVTQMKEMLRNIETLELTRCRISTRKLAIILNATESLKHLLIHGKMVMGSDLLAAIVERQSIESVRLRMTGFYDAGASQIREFFKQLKTMQRLKCLEILYLKYHHAITASMDILSTIDTLDQLVRAGRGVLRETEHVCQFESIQNPYVQGHQNGSIVCGCKLHGHQRNEP